MHKKDVPQDGGVIDPLQNAIYAVDDDGNYVTVPSVGWDVSNGASIQAAEEIHFKILAGIEAAKRGRLSPLGVHLIAHEMNAAGLAKVSGVSWLKVKLHLRPWFFNRISEADAKRYAEVFDIDPSKLREFPEPMPLPEEKKQGGRKPE